VKNPRTHYWITTGVMAAFMLLSAIPDILRIPGAIAIFRHLGYPAYLLPFLGTAKTLGVVSVLVPRFHKLKEWAFAGLFFDVTGALYSHLSVGDPASAWAPAAVGLVLVCSSYLTYRRLSIDRSGSRVAISGPDQGARPVGVRRRAEGSEPANIVWGN
jgi:DoxX-like family